MRDNDLLLEEEFKIWKKNIPHLYDMVFTTALKWQSPSVQWFPDLQQFPDRKITYQKILLNTFTAQEGKESLLIGKIGTPHTCKDENNAKITFELTQSIPTSVEVNRARYCPQSTNLIACRTESSEVLVYDYTKHPSKPQETKKPDDVFTGHKKGGFALDWNKRRFAEFITGGSDCYV